MLLLRIIGLLTAIGISASVFVYMVSGDRRYLRFAWQLFKYALFLVVLILLLLFFERLLAAG